MQSDDGKCVILFMKCPVPGRVKTRLAMDISDDRAAELYVRFIRDTLATLDQLDLHVEIFIDQIPGNGCEALDFVRQEFRLQFGEHLGERMKNAFAEVFSLGYHQAIILGSDMPDLPKSIINEAFQALSARDCVIGPSEDGGYYLLGFKQNTLLYSVFHGIQWSTTGVYRDTLRELDARAYNTYELPELRDVDDIGDLKAFVRRHAGGTGQDLHSIRYLKESGLWDKLMTGTSSPD